MREVIGEARAAGADLGALDRLGRVDEAAVDAGAVPPMLDIIALDDGTGLVRFELGFRGAPPPPYPILTEWDFGDGSTSLMGQPSHQYMQSGQYQVTVFIRNLDSGLAVSERTERVTIVEASPPGSTASSVGAGTTSSIPNAASSSQAASSVSSAPVSSSSGGSSWITLVIIGLIVFILFAIIGAVVVALLGVVGADGWKRIADDRFDWGGPDVSKALDYFGSYIAQADPAAGQTRWNDAVRKLARGECGYLTMNDSAYGELVAAGAVDGQQFGYAPFPGTEGNYLAIVDTFVAAKQARNGVNALKFLETVADPATMLAFTKVKGSVPVRRDVSAATLSDYQRGASAALWRDTVLLSMAHGELMNTAFQEALYAAVKDYANNKNQRAFINTVQRAGTGGTVGGR